MDRGGGYLTLTRPWPSMLRGIYGDPERYRDTYWSRFTGRYFAGDGAEIDEDGYLWLLGRVDDVMNVSGHRISTTEVESALVDHPSVAESAVVGATDPTSGQAIVAFVTLRADAGAPDDEKGQALRRHVAEKIGPIARPRTVVFTDELPKTRSGRSCGACSATWPRAVCWATPPRADPAVVDEIGVWRRRRRPTSEGVRRPVELGVEGRTGRPAGRGRGVRRGRRAVGRRGSPALHRTGPARLGRLLRSLR